MGFLSIQHIYFRNLANEETNIDYKQVILVGQNGQGKTNFLEALYYLCFGSSFRGKVDKKVPKYTIKEASLTGIYEDNRGDHSTVKVHLQGDKKRIYINGKIIKDRKEMVHSIPCIIFTHEDYLFVTGPALKRRYFFDQVFSLCDLIYIDKTRNYKTLLRERNSLLKKGDDTILDVYDKRLAETGLIIQRERRERVTEVNTIFSSKYEEISGLTSEVSVEYTPSWKQEEIGRLLEEMRERRPQEREKGVTMFGPHRDTYRIVRKGKHHREDFSSMASTGEARLASLALRIVQALLYREKVGRDPILLLDDVVLELDRDKRKAFFSSLPPHDQIFLTFLPGEEFNQLRAEKTIVYSVIKGRLFP